MDCYPRNSNTSWKLDAAKVHVEHEAGDAIAGPETLVPLQKDCKANVSSWQAEVAVLFTVTLDRTSGRALGLDVSTAAVDVLSVVRVKDGLAQEWNSAHTGLPCCVQVGDHILEVNGAHGSVKALLEACSQTRVLRLIFQKATTSVKCASAVLEAGTRPIWESKSFVGMWRQ